mmetsp:Transcript_7999/g.10430  ORF Transcript_7999/g.10430 Transcript_7999/m.10430 type:complete len:159 (-) Transcript_7999:1681-2157(-)
MKWEGKINKGQVVDLPTSLEDLFATFVEVSNAEHLVGKPRLDIPLDAVSLVPVMSGNSNAQEKRDYLYFEYCRLQASNWGTIKKNPDSFCSWAVRRKDGWKLVFDAEYYLFNLNADPFEMVNLYSTRMDIALDLFEKREEAHIPLADLGYSGQTVDWS